MFSVFLLWTVALLVSAQGKDCERAGEKWQFPKPGDGHWDAGSIFEIRGVQWQAKTNNVALKVYIIGKDGQTKTLCGEFAKGSLKAAGSGWITAKCTKPTKGRAAYFEAPDLETCGPDKKFWLQGYLWCPPGKVKNISTGLCEKEKEKPKTNTETMMGADGGTVYTRWASKSCPNTAELVYAGQAGGGEHRHSGDGSTMLCMHPQPEYNAKTVHDPKTDPYKSLLYGSEYEFHAGKKLWNNNIPCAVCLVKTRSVQVMIPGRWNCPDKSWTREYHGKLASGYHAHAHQKPYLCLDIGLEAGGGVHQNNDGAVLYLTQGVCGSLSCPPYQNKKIINCVVCSK